MTIKQQSLCKVEDAAHSIVTEPKHHITQVLCLLLAFETLCDHMAVSSSSPRRLARTSNRKMTKRKSEEEMRILW